MDEEPKDSKKKADFVRIWLNRIANAQRREKGYRKEGRKVIDLYEAKQPQNNPFAILYSNTETLAPALYNAKPIPMVERRFKDADPIGKLAAEVGTRVCKFLLDGESSDCDSFDELMQDGVLNAILVNRGNVRWKYEADTSTGEVKSEGVYGESVRWDKFVHGYARTWKKVPWICFEWDMGKDEVGKNFGDVVANRMSFDTTALEPEEGRMTGETPEQLTGVNLAKIYEVWDKDSKKVFFLSPNYSDDLLKDPTDDPLQLSGFFPICKPMNLMRKVTTLVPTPLYTQYEQQAKELNQLTVRLKKVVSAIKVRGIYDSSIQEFEKVLQADENMLVGAENVAALPDSRGLEKSVWLLPLAELMQVAQQLMQARESCKQVIYEITGISDILRGASQASETATAQQIKNQWGSLRLKKMQKEIQRYCRDSIRIMLEIAVTRFGVDTVRAMTGIDLPTEEQKQQAKGQFEAQMAQFRGMLQQSQMQAQMTGQPPQEQPPQPQQPPVLTKPSWEQILGLLKNDTLRNYKVDIETNSTIDAEAAQDKQDIGELMNAIAQFLNGVGPMVEKGMMNMGVAKAMLLTIVRRYNFGPQIEDQINAMPDEPPKQDEDPAAAMKMQVEQVKMQVEKAKAEAEMRRMQMEQQVEQQKFENEKQLMAMEMQMKQAELQMKAQEMELQKAGMLMKQQAAEQAHSFKMTSMHEKNEMDRQTREARAKETEVATV